MGKVIRHKRNGKNVGEYRTYDMCRFCVTGKLISFLSFGHVPLAGGFLKSKRAITKEKLYPLTICVCESCHLVQVREVVSTKTLFADYFYFSSAIGTLASHFVAYAAFLAERIADHKTKFVVEIGSNDGVFLRPLREEGFRVLGIDPAVNVVAKVDQTITPTISAPFTEQTAKEVSLSHGQADVIVTSNSFAHIDDMHDVMRGVVKLLKPDGMLCIETHDLSVLMQESQYDMMYHEHMSYYSLHALESFFHMYGMHIVDAFKVPMHGGSLRTFVQFDDATSEVSDHVREIKEGERRIGLDQVETFLTFGNQIATTKKDLRSLLSTIAKSGKSVAGYGASGRGTQVMSYTELTADDLRYVIDDAPAKIGCLTPGNHLMIVPSSVLQEKDGPEYCLLFAWSFASEIMKRNQSYIDRGGKFILPLPSVKVLP